MTAGLHNQGIECRFCGAGLAVCWPEANIYKCTGCGLMLRHPVPSDEDLAKLYGQCWSDPVRNQNETGGTTARLARLYAQKLAKSLGRSDFKGMRLLEFGAGRGDVLAALRDLGADIHAVEPFGYDYLERQGFRVFRSLEALPKGYKADGIVTIDTVEHLSNPWQQIQDLTQFLSDSGWLLVCTLNAAGLNARLKRAQWREAVKPVHLVFFTPGNFESLLIRCGYKHFQRLHWLLAYSGSPLRTCRDYALQLLHLDGELRYLLFNK